VTAPVKALKPEPWHGHARPPPELSTWQPWCVQIALTTITVPLARVTETGKVDLLTGLTSRIFISPSTISLDFATKVNPPALLVGTGVGVAFAVALGVGVALAVALGVGVSEGLAPGALATTFAPFFQINFPLDFTHVYVYPWKTIFCPSLVAFNVGPIAARALDPKIDSTAAGIIARRLRRISFMR